jgi:serine/threonine-protein kinase
MTPERWAQIKEIFSAVTELSADERTPALIQACQGDTALQAELEQLLAQYDGMGEFLEGSPPASAANLLSPGSVLADRYRIVALLGSGGMGDVYEAEDNELRGRIALKVVHPRMSVNDAVLDRFRREVLLARQVTHPNVCRVFDIGRHQQHGREIVFLTMEFVSGETLSARLKRDGRIAVPEALAIARQLCQALGAAHQAGVLHRDFKPGNVMLIGSGETIRAVVTDFGIARWIGRTADSPTTLTIQGAISGTPVYMSPEQVEGKQLTTASDIYSLGLVLYEMVTGARPFYDQSPWAEAIKRLTTDPPEPRKTVTDLDQAWNRAILKCLEREPARRISSAGEVLEALTGPKQPFSILRKRRVLVTTAAALAVTAALSAMALWARFGPKALPGRKHIAVLPFHSAGSGPEDQAVADELASSLSENLSRLESSNQEVWVVPWKSVQKRSAKDEAHAGPALGANLLVVGDFEKRGGQLRVHMKVKDARTLKELRLDDIAIPPSELTATEDTLLERVAAILQLHIPLGLLHHLPVDETREPGAYELYQQGRGYLDHRDLQNVDRAIVLFQKAISKDSKFALAHASLAAAYAWKFQDSIDQSWLDKAQKECSLAVSLDDTLPLARMVQGQIDRYAGNLGGAIESMERAVALDPSDDDARDQLATTYDKAGQFLRAEQLLKETVNRNRASWVNYDFLGTFYYGHHQYDQAEPLFRVAMDLAPDNPIAFYDLGAIYFQEGKCREAEPLLTHAIATVPSAAAYSNLGAVYFCLGRYPEAVTMFQKAIAVRPTDHRFWRNLGDALSSQGDAGQAGKAYAKAAETAEKALAVNRQNNELLGELALYYAKLGETRKAESALAKVPRSDAQSQDFMLRIAEVYEALGQHERALAALHAFLQHGYPPSDIENDLEFRQLRKDGRYAQLVRRGSSADRPEGAPRK